METEVGARLSNPHFSYAPFLMLSLLFLWPLALNGHPFYVGDSASYLRGGAAGVDTVMLMLREWWQGTFISSGGPGTAADGGSSAVVTAAIGQAGGTRSLAYSLLTYLLRMPGQSLLALVVFQAGAVAFVVVLVQRLMAPHASGRGRLAMMACLALLTPVAWSATTAMPDILAGVALLGSVPLTLYLERLGVVERIALVLLLALAIAAHVSHLPLALATLATGAAARLLLRRPNRAAATRDALWILSAPLLALTASFALSYVGFGTASVAPKRYPILLARSVADGPGLRYLQAHCGTERYAICEIFGTNFPTHPGEFLWGPNGVRYRATPGQMERIRAEEWSIVRRAAVEYPMLQLDSSTRNFLRQFGSFGLGKVDFRAALVVGPTGRVDLVNVSDDRPQLRRWLSVVIYIVFGASLVILYRMRRRLTELERAALIVVVTGLVANAAVCGVLSGVADRYQARVAWVIPLLAIMLLLKNRNEPPASAGAGTAKGALSKLTEF
jgi:hypothetical protein